MRIASSMKSLHLFLNLKQRTKLKTANRGGTLFTTRLEVNWSLAGPWHPHRSAIGQYSHGSDEEVVIDVGVAAIALLMCWVCSIGIFTDHRVLSEVCHCWCVYEVGIMVARWMDSDILALKFLCLSNF